MDDFLPPNIDGKTDKEIINLYSDYLFQYAKKQLEIKDNLVDEEIEDLYFRILERHRSDSWNFDKEKVYKSHLEYIDSYESKGEFEKLNDSRKEILKKFKQEIKESGEIRNKYGLFYILYYKVQLSTFHKKKEIGYLVYLEFKRKIIDLPSKKKKRHTDVNFKFALLEEMGVINWLKTNIPTNNEDRADILMELIGGQQSTLVDYLKGKTINKDVRQKALDMITDKRYPK